MSQPLEIDAAVIGAGPAGLMAAEVLRTAGLRVHVFDRMPSAGRKLLMPTFILYGETTYPKDGPSLVEEWKSFGDAITGESLDCGLYAMEEAPEATFAALDRFL